MSSSSTNQTRKSRKKLAIVVTFLILFFLLVLGLGAIAALLEFFGIAVFGTEVNRLSLEVRQFSYRSGPFTGKQRSAIFRERVPSTLITELQIMKWTPPEDPAASVWDLASLNGSTTPSKHEIAHGWALMIEDPSFNDYWVDWIRKNPKVARVVFPAIVELIQHEAYEEIPALLDRFVGRIPPNYSEIVDDYLKQVYQSRANSPGANANVEELKALAASPFSERNSALKLPLNPASSDSPSNDSTSTSSEETVEEEVDSEPETAVEPESDSTDATTTSGSPQP